MSRFHFISWFKVYPLLWFNIVEIIMSGHWFYFYSEISAWIGSLYIAHSYIFGSLATRLIKRFGFRITAITGCLIISIGFCASSFTDNFWLFFFMFSVIGGLGSAISYHCSVLVVLNHFEKWLSLAVGITASSSSAVSYTHLTLPTNREV